MPHSTIKLLPLDMTIVAFELGQSPTAMAEALAELELVDTVPDPDTDDVTLLASEDVLTPDDVEVLPVFETVEVLADPEATNLAPQTPPLLTATPRIDLR